MNSHFMEEGSWTAQNIKKILSLTRSQGMQIKAWMDHILYPPVEQKWTFPPVPGMGRRAEQWELPFAPGRSVLPVSSAVWQSPARLRVCPGKPAHVAGDCAGPHAAALPVPAPDHCCHGLGKACERWCTHGWDFGQQNRLILYVSWCICPEDNDELKEQVIGG